MTLAVTSGVFGCLVETPSVQEAQCEQNRQFFARALYNRKSQGKSFIKLKCRTT